MKSVYIHIPFCKNICSYCDFCKFYYNEIWVDKYLIELEKEIKNNYKGELVKTLYIGGGTPSSLNINQLNKLFEIIKLFNKKDIEFTIECNIEDIDINKLELFKKNNINRISVGLETNNLKYLKDLNRNKFEIDKFKLIKKYFKNINIDLMYAFKDETILELKNDLDFILNLDVPHISTYSLIIEPHTILYNKKYCNVNEDIDADMYSYIKKYLKDYKHYETSNFSKKGYESKHNLEYWNNNEYYGFGIGSSGYIDGIRYDNTKSIKEYLKGNYRYIEHKLDLNEKIENEFILGFRKIKGINKNSYFKKYNIDIHNEIVNKLLKEGKLKENKNYIYVNKEYLYLLNMILVEFIGEVYV